MSHVFISYARSTERQAEQVEQALRTAGFDVWRDSQLPAHQAYADVIEERLRSAKAVVVLWSVDAVKSQWVRAEADAARSAGTLVQSSLDGAVPPLPFNQIHCADLNRWAGETDSPGWNKLVASVATLVGQEVELAVPPKKPATDRISVCVLPFINMSGDPEQEYFSDGISEDITTDLSKVSALDVTARNTAFAFKGRAVDITDLSRKIGVSHVLEGSVRKAGNRVRITAQLIDGASGNHLWADRFDRDLTDIFTIQDEISAAIVTALKLTLLPEEKEAIEHRGTADSEAYNLYLMARQSWANGNLGDRRREEQVVRLCERAVALDPHYAEAWALIALARVSLRFNFGDRSADGAAAADTALALNPNLAVAHAAKGRHHLEQGEVSLAEKEIAKALELDGGSWEVNKEAGRLHLAKRRIPTAAAYYEKAVSVMENDFTAWAMLLTCYQATGDQAKARHAGQMMFTEAQRALEQDPHNGAALGIAAGGLAAMGEAERVKEWIEKAMLLDPSNLNMRYNFACVLAQQLADTEAAIDMLATTLPLASTALVRSAGTDPDFDPLRDNPRFVDLLTTAQHRLRLEPSEPMVVPSSPLK